MVDRSTQRPKALPAALTGHVGYLAVLAGQLAQRTFEQAISGVELSPHQYDFLATAHECGPLTQRQLADILGVDAGRVVATTDALEARGLVIRSTDPKDRRRNHILLTTTGQALTVRAAGIAAQVEGELLAPLSSREHALLRDLLRRVVGLDGD